MAVEIYLAIALGVVAMLVFVRKKWSRPTAGGGSDGIPELQGGELYVFRDKKNSCWRFAKVLASCPEEDRVFIRTYKQRFDEPPAEVDFAGLSVGGMDESGGPKIGCAPIWYQSVVDEWNTSPNYGRVPISTEEIDTVAEVRKMMRE